MRDKIYQFLIVILILFFLTLYFFPFASRVSFVVPLPTNSLGYMLGNKNNLVLEQFSPKDTMSEGNSLKIEMQIKEFDKNSSKLSITSDYENSVALNRLKNWFSLNRDNKRLIEFAKRVRKNLVNEISKFEFGEIAQTSIESSSCVCSRFDGLIDQKAYLMNLNIDELSTVLEKEKKSSPLIIVHDLILETNQIDFSLCFRVSSGFKFLHQNEKYYLKEYDFSALNMGSEFFGNFSLSHHNMFRVLNVYDQRIVLKQDILFVEEFSDNPFNGGDDRKWKSKVYFSLN